MNIRDSFPAILPLAVAVLCVTASWEVLAADDAVDSVKTIPVPTAAESMAGNQSEKGENKPDGKVSKYKESSVKRGVKAASVEAASVSRIKELTYSPSDVYVIRTKYGYQTNIVFDPKEDIQSISVGDRSLWQIIPVANRLFIRPMTENLSTNMTLLTSKRSYEFELKSVDKRSEGNVYVVRFVYPSESDMAIAALAADEGVASFKDAVTASSPTSYKQSSSSESQNVLKLPSSYSDSGGYVRNNYSYTYSGPDAIAPLQVYDDGKATFIKYQSIDQSSVPRVFRVGADGKESPVDAVIQGSSLYVSGVAGELALRGNGGEIRIYNESLGQR